MSFPIHAGLPVAHPGPPPDRADVVVIGGGIIGVMTAWELAAQGVSVVLLEKGRIAGEQSSRNWGWIRVQGRDLAEVPIVLEAQQMWRELAPQLDADIHLRQTGTLYLTSDQGGMAAFQDWLDQVQGYGLDSHLLSGAQVAKLMPAATRSWAGALYTPQDYRAEPWVTVPAMARAAVAAGAQVIEDCAVRGLDMVAGRVAGVVTEAGRIATTAVVLAGGAWSSLFLRRHGVSIPQLSVRASVAATGPLPLVHDGGAVDETLAFRRRGDGGYTLAPEAFHELFVGPDAFRAFGHYVRQFIKNPLGTRLRPAAPKGYPDAWATPRRWADDAISPFERMRVLNPTPNAAQLRRLTRDFAATFNSIGDVPVAASWAGMIDTMPDAVPVVDHCAALPGLTICTGLSGHGFGIGPGFGRIAARLATGAAPGHDLQRFRLSRFSDGSPLVPGPNL